MEYKVLFDEDYLGNMDVFYCWFLLLIYGAKGRKLKFYGNHNIEDLNEYKALDYKFRSYDITNGNKTVGPLVIFFKETGEEIAELL